MGPFISLLVAAVIATVVYFDAQRLGARRGRLGGGLLDQGPVAWAITCCLCSLVTIPCYLFARRRLKRAARLRREVSVQTARTVHPVYAGTVLRPNSRSVGGWPPEPVAPPLPRPAPGWYPDPGGAPFARWWDGLAWTGHTR